MVQRSTRYACAVVACAARLTDAAANTITASCSQARRCQALATRHPTGRITPFDRRPMRVLFQVTAMRMAQDSFQLAAAAQTRGAHCHQSLQLLSLASSARKNGPPKRAVAYVSVTPDSVDADRAPRRGNGVVLRRSGAVEVPG